MAKYDYLNNYLNSNMNTYKGGGMFRRYDVGGSIDPTYYGGQLKEVKIPPKKRGFWKQSIDQYLKEHRDDGLLGALGSVITYPLGLPQQAMMYATTGKVQRPSEALDIKNKWGALGADMVIDPLNLAGAGLLGDASKINKLIKEGEFLGAGRTALGSINKVANPLAGVGNAVNDKINKVIQNREDLKYAEEWAKKYDYNLPENLDRISESDMLTDRTIKGLVNRHNTFARGVSTNWEHLEKTNPEILRHLEGKGIDWKNNPQEAAEYMATHVPINTGYGRVGMTKEVYDKGLEGLYSSNSIPTAEGYTYGDGYIVKAKRPTDFSSKNRQDWINRNQLDYYEHSLPGDYSKEKLNEAKNISSTNPRSLYNERLLGSTENVEKVHNWLDVLDKKELELRKKYGINIKGEGDFKIEGLNYDEPAEELFEKKRKDVYAFRDELEDFHKKSKDEVWETLKPIEHDDFSKRLLKTEFSPIGEFQDFGTTISSNNDFVKNAKGLTSRRKESLLNKLQDIAEEVRSNKGTNNEIILAQHRFLRDEFRNRYAHYIHIGTPGEKILEPVSSKRITPEIWENKSRAHTNKYTKGLSAGAIAGVVALQQDKNGDTINTNMKNNNTYANGGMFTSYNVGGTHEQNPNGGIPLGSDSTVEQGETSVDLDEQGAPTQQPTGQKYIFSDRQVWTPEDVKMAGLPSIRKSITAGQYMAKLNEKFSGRAGSKPDKETLDTFTKRATQLAEQKRMQKEQLERAMQLNSQQIAPENTEVPDGMEEFQEQPQQFNPGGYYSNYFNQAANAIDTSSITAPKMPTGLGTDVVDTDATSGTLGNAGSYIKAAGTAFDLYNTAKKGNTSTNTGKAIGMGAAQGAIAGSSFGPWGALAGGIYGAGAGYFGSKKAEKNENQEQNRAIAQVNAGMPNASAWSGIGGPAPQGVVSAHGGYITSKPANYSDGGIHINPENRGKFNATKARTGKTTEELTHSSNPLTRKRAIFAQNAAKWHHADGGPIKDIRRPGDELVLPPRREMGQTFPRYIPTSNGVPNLSGITDTKVRQGTQDFISWYSNPETKRRFQKNTGFDSARLNDLVNYGANVPARQVSQAYPFLGADSQAEFQGYSNVPKEQIIYEPGVDRGVIGHERIHASGLDTIMGPALRRVLGDPYKQTFKNAKREVKRNMNIPEESYGNFHQFRSKLGLKPGEQIKDIKTLRERAKASGADIENFYQTYDDDKIMKAINTIAQTGNNNNIYAAHGGYRRFDDGGRFKPEWMNDSYLQPDAALGRYPGEGTMSDDDFTKSLVSQYTPSAEALKTDYFSTPGSSPSIFNEYANKAYGILKGAAGKGADWLNENQNSLLRAYPIVSNIIEKGKIRKPVGHYGARLNDAYNVPMPDETSAMRDVNTAYNNRYRAIGQMGGSQAQQRAAMLGIGAQQNQAISQTQQGLEELKMNRAMQEQQFKTQIAQYNAAKSDQDRDLMDRDQAKYDELRSKFTSQIANDIGTFGLEQDRMDQVANMYGYDRKGKYMINRATGKIATPEELSKLRAAVLTEEEKKKATAAYGGYLTRRPSKY